MLQDILAEGLAVVFSTTAVADRSARVEAYYASSRNKFWSTLFRTKLTPRQFRPEEFELIVAHDIGLADLQPKRRSATVAEADDVEYDVDTFKKKITENKPTIVAFNGKEAAKRCLNKDAVDYGRQSVKFAGATVYVLPSTSDKARDYWDDKYWNELAAEVRKVRSGR